MAANPIDVMLENKSDLLAAFHGGVAIKQAYDHLAKIGSPIAEAIQFNTFKTYVQGVHKTLQHCQQQAAVTTNLLEAVLVGYEALLQQQQGTAPDAKNLKFVDNDYLQEDRCDYAPLLPKDEQNDIDGITQLPLSLSLGNDVTTTAEQVGITSDQHSTVLSRAEVQEMIAEQIKLYLGDVSKPSPPPVCPVPDHIDGFKIGKTAGKYYRATRRLGKKMVSVYIGSTWDEELAKQKIAEVLKANA